MLFLFQVFNKKHQKWHPILLPTETIERISPIDSYRFTEGMDIPPDAQTFIDYEHTIYISNESIEDIYARLRPH